MENETFFPSIYVAVVVVVAVAVAACGDAIVNQIGRYLQIYTVTNEAGISK